MNIFIREFIHLYKLVIAALCLTTFSACNIGMVDLKRKLSSGPVVQSLGRVSVTGPTSAAYKECVGPFSVKLESVDGQAFESEATVSVNLSLRSGSAVAQAVLYADESCQQTTQSLNVAGGPAESVFYLLGNLPQAIEIVASAASLDSDVHTIVVVREAARLAVTGPTTVILGDCSAAFTVSLQDRDGVAALPAADVRVTLGSSGGLNFYSSNSCDPSFLIGETTIRSGTAGQQFYAKATVAGAVVARASNSTLAAASRQVVVNREIRQLLLSGPSSLPLGNCAALSLSARDALGVEISSSVNRSVNLTPVLATEGGYFSDSGCANSIASTQLLANQSSVTVYFRPRAVRVFSLQASLDAGRLITSNSKDISAVQTVVGIRLSRSSDTIRVGLCESVDVELIDGLGAVLGSIGPRQIALQTNGSGSFFSAANCAGNSGVTSVSFADRQTKITFYYKANAVTPITLTASSSQINPGALPLSVIASLEAVSLSGPSSTQFVAGSCVGPFSVSLFDGIGSVFRVSANTSVSLSGKGTGSTFMDAACSAPVNSPVIANDTSTISFYYLNGAAQSSTNLSATVGNRTSNNYTYSVVRNALALDSSFGNAGIASWDGPESDGFKAAAMQSDGKLVTAGSSRVDGSDYLLVARFTVAGGLDATFGNGGAILLPIGQAAVAEAVVVGNSGIYVLGWANRNGGDTGFIVKLNSNGSLANNFGSGGKAYYNFSGAVRVTSGKAWGQSRLALAGSFTSGSSTVGFVAVVSSNGNLDTNFGGSGVVQFPEIASVDAFVDDGNDAVVAGSIATNNGNGSVDLFFSRLNFNGSRVGGFGVNGALVFDGGSDSESISSIVIDASGNFAVAVGRAGQGNGQVLMTSMNKLSGGGRSVQLSRPVNSASSQDARGLIVNPDGGYFVVGVADDAPYIAQYSTSLLVQNRFSFAGIIGAGTGEAVQVQADGKPLMVGSGSDAAAVTRHFK